MMWTFWKVGLMAVQRIAHPGTGEGKTGGQQPGARRPAAAPRHGRAIWVGVELATAARALRDPRLQARLVTWAIGLAALARLARDNQNRNFARLAAWDRRLSDRSRRGEPG